MYINKFLWQLASENRKKIAIVGILDFTIAFMDVLTAVISAGFLTNVMCKNGVNIPVIIASLFGIVCIRYILAKFRAQRIFEASEGIKKNLRQNLMNKLLILGPAYMTDKRTGDLVSTVWSKVEWLNHYYGKYIPAALATILNSTVISTLVWSFDSTMGIVCAVVVLAVLIVPIVYCFVASDSGAKEWEESTKYYSDCLDGLQGILTLKALNANGKYCEEIHDQGEKLRKSSMKHLNEMLIENGAFEFLSYLGNGILIIVSAVRYMDGKLGMQELAVILFVTQVCFKYLTDMLTAWHMGYKGILASKEISCILNEKELLNSSNRQPNLPICGSDFSVRFEDVHFAYNKEEGEVLKGISFEIPTGTTMAIVGKSGSGKSTIAHLLAGFYLTEHGKIYVGNAELSDKNIAEVQNQIAAVWQDSYIFYGSCMDNIRIGNPNASDEEVYQAAKKANIHDFILQLENGYDTILGERGLRVSGGERQRIAIARAFLRNSPIIIFDEATSALDGGNEKEIQAGFEELKKGKTVLIIAHRLETIQNAEQVCMIEKGNIIGMGTHEYLEKTSMEYRRLMGIQKGRVS